MKTRGVFADFEVNEGEIVPKRIKNIILYFLLCAMTLLCGCSREKTPENEISGQYWQSSDYTIEEINAKFHEKFYNDEREFKAADVSGVALRAYNIMLGYAESIIGTEYYVYDYYFADWEDPPHAWVIKLVPYEMARTAESEDRGIYISEPISMFFNEDDSAVQSTIEPYFMEKKWFSELEAELSESFPEYEYELSVSEFEATYPDVLHEKIPVKDDYTYLINDDFYSKLSEWEYGNVIDVQLPANIKQSGAAEIFERLKPTLSRYCVTQVRMFGEGLDEVERFAITGSDIA